MHHKNFLAFLVSNFCWFVTSQCFHRFNVSLRTILHNPEITVQFQKVLINFSGQDYLLYSLVTTKMFLDNELNLPRVLVGQFIYIGWQSLHFHRCNVRLHTIFHN